MTTLASPTPRSTTTKQLSPQQPVLIRAVEWFNTRGITVGRVLSDNGGAYRSHLWRDTCADRGIKHKRTRPYRPQTNGKIERFHRTMADGWAYARCYTSEVERRGTRDICTSDLIGQFSAVVMNSWTPAIPLSYLGEQRLPVDPAFVQLLHQAYVAEPAIEL